MLILGVRYRGELTRAMIFGTGALGGLFAGAVGLPGPPVIMLYMASTLPAKVVRANLTLYLIVADIILVCVLWLGGLLVLAAVATGILMIVPYLFGNWIGAVMFRPEVEKYYRTTAYVIIAASAIMGIPFWD
ncbi:MAG: hypothetical protein GKR98_03955 [Boseongicola sp.]|nr:MAG: hypothetical protein GKR98_03955 [Boseongicola sp.]